MFRRKDHKATQQSNDASGNDSRREFFDSQSTVSRVVDLLEGTFRNIGIKRCSSKMFQHYYDAGKT